MGPHRCPECGELMQKQHDTHTSALNQTYYCYRCHRRYGYVQATNASDNDSWIVYPQNDTPKGTDPR